jgi:hypothetical protein
MAAKAALYLSRRVRHSRQPFLAYRHLLQPNFGTAPRQPGTT